MIATTIGQTSGVRMRHASGVRQHQGGAAEPQQDYREADASRSPETALPPSERDFLLFEAVAFGGASTREAAAEFEISQTRVMQIRRHVSEWIARSVPDGLDLSPIERLRLAAHIAQGRTDHLYSLAVQAWRQSQQPATSACRGPARASHGDPRYLLVAARLSERQIMLAGAVRKVMDEAERSKFQVSGFTSGTGEQKSEVGTREGEAPAEPQALLGKPAEAPAAAGTSPDRDCSREAVEVPPVESTAALPLDATSCDDERCGEIEARRQAFLAALEDDTAPVHPPFTDAGGMLLDASQPVQSLAEGCESVIQLKLNGHEPGAALSTTALADTPPAAALKRHDRRARQRELDRLRRRAR